MDFPPSSHNPRKPENLVPGKTRIKSGPYKTGIMGGSFNPLHLGHINSFFTVREKFQLDKIILVPAFHPPLSRPLTGAEPRQRLEMLRRAFSESPFIEIDDQELKREGASYSYRTVEMLAQNPRYGELFFIMGLDQFLILDRWKNVPRILKGASLIVTTRPGLAFPKIPEELPRAVRTALKSSFPEKIVLEPPFRNVYFCRLRDREISSSLIKTLLKNRRSIARLVPPAVNRYIKTRGLYGVLPRSAPSFGPEDPPAFCKKGGGGKTIL